MAGIAVLTWLAFVGLAVGSFLGVVIRRSGTRAPPPAKNFGMGAGIVRGRSFCPSCRKQLDWFALIPLLSFSLQRGRCRSCRQSIPLFYPTIEIITAVLFVALGKAALAGILPPPPFAPLAFGGPGTLGESGGWLLYYAFFGVMALIISFHDFERRLIPPAPVRLLITVGIGAQLAGLLKRGDIFSFFPAVLVAGGAFVLFWSIWFFSRGRAMGRGDADVALAIGLYLGPAAAAWGLLLAFWFGAAGGILLVLTRRLGLKSRIPFAPFLFGGALVSLLVGTSWGALNPFPHVF